MTAVSRRAFFAQAPAATVAAAIPSQTPPPPQAWIITEQNWDYNDEFMTANGETLLPTLFYDRVAAETECRRLNDEFYAAQPPDEFEVDWLAYFPAGLPDGQTETEITWDQLKLAGWADPYAIHRLTLPGATADE